MHELAERHDGGILVRLLWDPGEDRVLVDYRDQRSGDAFTAEVPRPRALDAFRHPNLFRTSGAPRARRREARAATLTETTRRHP